MRHQPFYAANNDISVAFWTAIFTLIGGILIFTVQKLLEQIYLIPINKQKGVIEKIAVGLIKYANYYANPTLINDIPSDSTQRRDMELAADATREFSALLTATTTNISNYGFWYRLRLIKVKKEDALSAASKLMRLSNSYFNSAGGIKNADLADEIRKLLHILKS